MAKFRMLHDLLLAQGVISCSQLHRPVSIARRDLERVHSRRHHEAFSGYRLTRPDEARS